MNKKSETVRLSEYLDDLKTCSHEIMEKIFWIENLLLNGRIDDETSKSIRERLNGRTVKTSLCDINIALAKGCHIINEKGE